ncbi:uncharacterized protein C8R40DRAFT_1173128 [Lentinula edodes]|uniref:uncharacterized protein n=1 Tax=Lentinula edodes TaxID=5353 RepID=UPI001E8E8FD4|nr:uncharacterized protein C8R40DRAFT_1173128 [Lentinula edodes]KAH7873065.1 hypothetical protein C8R40DRAFT_1173128 [Lentinula edodes]
MTGPTNTSLARVIFREIILAFYITDGTSTDPPPPSPELAREIEENAGTLIIIMGLVFCLFLGLALVIETIVVLIHLTYVYVIRWVRGDELRKREQAVVTELDVIRTASTSEDRFDEQEVETELFVGDRERI